MNVCIVRSETTRWPKMKWLADAFRAAQHDVREISRPHELDDADKWADVCLFQQRSVIRYPNLRLIADRRRSIWIQLWFDLLQVERGVPLSEQPDIKKHRNLMRLMDCVCVKESLPLDAYQQLRLNTVFLDQGIPERVIIIKGDLNNKSVIKGCHEHSIASVPPSSCRWDVVVWGQGAPRYSQRFKDAKALVDAGFKVGWIGPHGQTPDGVECIDWSPPDELPLMAYYNARVVLSVGYRNDVEGYHSDSLLLGLASGRPVVKRSETAFATAPYIGYKTHDELIRIVRWLCNNPEKSEDLGKKACRWLREHKTLKQTVKSLEALIARIVKARDSWLSQQNEESPFGESAFASAPA